MKCPATPIAVSTLSVTSRPFRWCRSWSRPASARFTHTTKRQKYRNITSHPEVAMSISDPDNPYRYLEVRGVVEEIVPDPTAAFYLHLNDRYSGPLTEAPPDAPDRVVIVVRPTGFSKQ